ncbi:hypothetical protein SLS53_005114 [Cytospora paraplurivora]|uniref:Uncharacterized protein n=1 Tax=Cytospora paraplurivora TaxID=2898453 RepID=A0AAN9UDX2_9PEZI
MPAPSASYTPFTKWIQSKILHVEVTFSVYIFTPLEKFLFWSFVFLLFSLTAIATILYLPHHILFLVGRAWFYIHGDSALEVAKETARTLVQHAATTTKVLVGSETAKAVAGVAGDFAKAEL